ncbi:MAG: Stp1/IreP family PP2C-type Ser/Thr phosphatase [Peptoniphilaceae bacterium]|nr:Stp1/IreP family PP2C-type Ser/Thr phosphatase [Peptoniphilaceae bacterium]MDY6085589.1 Stp1/IreP family PP2C-type Ser/Thr phosphatase [Peptoniphilaceae bacterium]
MNFYSITDQGKSRSMNQDRYANYFHSRFSLFLLADGMGGHNAGEVAAEVAIESARSYVMEQKSRSDYEALLREAVAVANRSVYEKSMTAPELRRMGTTLCAVLIDDARVYVAHVGDSRVYRFFDGQLQQVTRDHSVVADLLAQGLLTEEEALHHPDRNTLTRAVGTEEETDVDVDIFERTDFARWLLTSDGLTKMVDDARIQEILTEETDSRTASVKLVNEANANGGLDNITVTLVDLGELNGNDPAEQSL